GEVRLADHERDEVIGEPDEERDDREQDHGDAVNGEQLVVQLGIHEVRLRRRELRTDDERLEPAEDEEGRTHPDVQDPDLLVSDGPQPSRGAAAAWPQDPAGDRRHRRAAKYAVTAS